MASLLKALRPVGRCLSSSTRATSDVASVVAVVAVDGVQVSEMEARAKAGDAAAFSSLISSWDGDLRGVVWTVVRSRTATDQVMKRAYETAFGNIDRFDGTAPLKTWLHTICLSGAIEHTRTAGNGGDKASRLFDSLSRVDQLLVMLRTGLGCSAAETATIVGIAQAHAGLPDAGRMRGYLKSLIPDPSPGYWDDIDRQLGVANDVFIAPAPDAEPAPALAASAPAEATAVMSAVSAGRPAAAPTEFATSAEAAARQADDASEDTDADAEAMFPSIDWQDSRTWKIAAVIFALLIFGAMGLNRCANDPDDELTASVQDGGATDVDDLSSEEARDASPLQAIAARLQGQVPETGAAGGHAGPYCFVSPDAAVVPASDIVDRRAFVWVDVAVDGLLNFYALQGEDLAIGGAAYPTNDGVASIQTQNVAGLSGELPPTTLVVSDDALAVGEQQNTVSLIACESVQDRLDTLLRLIDAPADSTVSANWPPSESQLSSSGLGPLRIGMTVSELATELGVPLSIETLSEPTVGGCGEIRASDALSNDLRILVELTRETDGIVRRVSVRSTTWSTPSGGVVGLTEQQILDLFPGQIESIPHAYVEGTYLTYQPADASDPNTVRFVNESGRIAEIHAGDRAWVGLVEGCA